MTSIISISELLGVSKGSKASPATKQAFLAQADKTVGVPMPTSGARDNGVPGTQMCREASAAGASIRSWNGKALNTVTLAHPSEEG